ncbi:hypothetical protein PR048_013908 [Dryococelus australis]|uniref:Uncharacterized protein n=1 Tax=Dryococelus australis TaxID=614101 RepID=A0ABQ9HTR9_9NEOP|nr:hypothetical protein PR048_013908 [Dryococelus australis]
MLRWCRDDTNFLIMFCRRTGHISKGGIFNLHSWSIENSHIIRDSYFQHHRLLIDWAIEQPARLNSETYSYFLQHNLL